MPEAPGSREWCGEATGKRWCLSGSGRWCRLESWTGEECDVPPRRVTARAAAREGEGQRGVWGGQFYFVYRRQAPEHAL